MMTVWLPCALNERVLVNVALNAIPRLKHGINNHLLRIIPCVLTKGMVTLCTVAFIFNEMDQIPIVKLVLMFLKQLPHCLIILPNIEQ